jgi:hypothetical protein
MKRAACVSLAILSCARAWAVDVRAIGGADLLLASGPSMSGVEDAELGLTLRTDVRDVANRLDFKLDFMGRQGFIGNSSYDNLYELSGVAKKLGGIVDITFGRIRTPGGFWLIADGAMVTLHYTSWLKQDVYGGLRSFTTGRDNTWMTSHQPVALPLAGTSLSASHRLISGALTFSYAKDAIDLHTGYVTASNTTLIERHLEDEYFLDGQLAIYPCKYLFGSAGASLGTRYDVQFDAANPYGPTTLGIATLGSVDAYALLEYRPWKRLRIAYSFNFERVRLFQGQLLTVTAAGTPVQAADGSFQDHELRATWLAWRALRLEARYRLRYRDNTDVEHHPELSLRGDELWHGLGVFGAIAIDIDNGIAFPGGNAATDKVHNRVVYSAGLSYLRRAFDVRAGVTYTDGIGSGLTFSQQSPSGSGAAPTTLFPYLLESNRIAFVRAFAMFWKMYGGVDVEEDLDVAQLRVLVQAGATL